MSDERQSEKVYVCIIPPNADCPHWRFRMERVGWPSPVLQWFGHTRSDAMKPPLEDVHGFLWRVFTPHHAPTMPERERTKTCPGCGGSGDGTNASGPDYTGPPCTRRGGAGVIPAGEPDHDDAWVRERLPEQWRQRFDDSTAWRRDNPLHDDVTALCRVIAEQVEATRQALDAKGKAEKTLSLMQLLELHDRPEACPNWYDGCHCAEVNLEAVTAERDALKERAEKAEHLQPCGHPGACLMIGKGGANYCRWCEDVENRCADALYATFGQEAIAERDALKAEVERLKQIERDRWTGWAKDMHMEGGE